MLTNALSDLPGLILPKLKKILHILVCIWINLDLKKLKYSRELF